MTWNVFSVKIRLLKPQAVPELFCDMEGLNDT